MVAVAALPVTVPVKFAVIVPAAKLPLPSRATILLAVFAVSAVAPFNKLAFKLGTLVVLATEKGAVPVTRLLVIWPDVESPVRVPTLVREEAVTPAARVVPDRVPAGATTTAVVIEVVRPFALIVMTGIAVELPVVPAVATFARVPVAVTLPVPSKFGEV